MRTSRLSAQEIAELDEANKKETRKQGFALMPIRDRGHARLSSGADVRWHTDKWTTQGNFMLRSTVPSGMFEIDGKLYDAEELRKYLRWA